MQEPAKQRRRTEPSAFADSQFLNIDLDVRSRRSLTPLVAAWPWSYQPLIAERGVEPRWLIAYSIDPGDHTDRQPGSQ